MYTIYIYDENWISVAIVEHIAESEMKPMVEKLKAGGFNVSTVSE